MIEGYMWRRIDLLERPPFHLTSADECYHAREYVSGGGWSASECNRLVSNFKKPVGCKGKPEWFYKEQAAKQFAEELSLVLPAGAKVIPIPTSMITSNPLFDPRMEMTMEALKGFRKDVEVETRIIRSTDADPLHGGGARKVDVIRETLSWVGGALGEGEVFLIDDVITSGAHFKACEGILSEHAPGSHATGMFWARTIWPSPFSPLPSST